MLSVLFPLSSSHSLNFVTEKQFLKNTELTNSFLFQKYFGGIISTSTRSKASEVLRPPRAQKCSSAQAAKCLSAEVVQCQGAQKCSNFQVPKCRGCPGAYVLKSAQVPRCRGCPSAHPSLYSLSQYCQGKSEVKEANM